MKILIVTVGSRGDVQPYVALGKGLRESGHDVTLCTCESFKTFVSGHGLAFAPMSDEIVQLIQSDTGRGIVEDAQGIFGMLKTMLRLWNRMGPMQRAMLSDSWKAVQAMSPDVIIFHPKAYGGPHFAEKLGVRSMLALPLPMLVPSGEKPGLMFPALGWRWYNRLTHRFIMAMMQLSSGRFIRDWRKQNGLPPMRRGRTILDDQEGRHIPVMHCYSAHVAPPPRDWPESVTVTGYWFLDRDRSWRPARELEDFLQAGEPPVYIGFGSLAGRDPERLTCVAIEALERSGKRGILATGWGGLAPGALPGTIFKLDEAPHDWLFPRVGAVVHHGGAGSTAAGLRFGKPTLVCPFFGDQPFWGARVHELGAGPKPIPQKQLSAEKLAAAIGEMMDNPAMGQNAEALGVKIRAEDGIGNAIRFIEKWT